MIDYVAPFRARLKLGNFAGRSIAVANVLQKAELAAGSDTPILITGGGPGCGKMTLARIIHDNCARREQPFVEVACAATPRTLSERKLVGSAQVADGCASETTGAIGAAQGGTLYLREVSCLSRSAQSTLLRLLLTREFSPVGSSSRPADVRIIASSNSDLLQDVARERLSEDLFLRLNMTAIIVPPLAERREDIVPLAQYLCGRVHRSLGINWNVLELSPDALETLEASHWEGNIRDLEVVILDGAIRASIAGSRTILATHLLAICPNP